MSIDDLSSSTRVFVSGLPASLTSKDLRAFFSQKFRVTDAHVLPDRRIGFVGFESHGSAELASKYFNKSFIRMSRISVELAKPVDVKRDSSGQAAPISKHGLRKHNRTFDGRSSTQKRKRDGLDDGEALRRTNSQPLRNRLDASKADRAENSYRASLDEMSESVSSSKREDPGDSESVDDSKTSEEHAPPSAPASDSDWLRGKTNRVLDLEEPEDDRRTSKHRSPSPARHLAASEAGSSVEHSNATGPSMNVNDDESQVSNGRLFFRNLSFDATEDDLRALLVPLGHVEEVHLVKDSRTSKCKGLAFAQFRDPSEAQKTMQLLDGKPFQGRLLHILPASDKKSRKLSDFEISKLPLKKQKDIRRKLAAPTASFSWNSLYMNPDAVLASVADRLGLLKSQLLDPSSTDAAVKQAQAETSIIQETKDYLSSRGINVDAFKSKGRHDRALLLKNFPFGTTLDELTTMLSKYGLLETLIFPPTGTMAIALFQEPYAAQTALKNLAYSNIRGSVLYLQQAPEGIFDEHAKHQSSEASHDVNVEEAAESADLISSATATVFVRNLNFSTTSARLAEMFKPLTGFLSARVKTRTDASRPGEVLSMGFGFVEFRHKQQAHAAVSAMSGHRLDGHEILLQLSNKTLDAAEERRKDENLKKGDQEKTKIVIKNLPFEATKKDIKTLFGAYGKLRSVRMPRKFDNSARGFAFAEFITAKEAKNAIEALSSTHLLGRRIVLDFAAADIDDPEETIKAMEKKAERENHLTTVNKLTAGSTRRKFNAGARDEEDI